ncbi:alpha/beta fold hydrolase [Paenibacillus septentrionalis]|uniref:Alpha/beta fold hydrolase n=1 Tax=Paenibacillus septentrionalis TaxID=429342 RepID=A0ABW1V794_9BACL
MTQSISNARYTLKNGLALAYYDSKHAAAGQNQQPIVVLLHGYCGSSAYFKELAPLLEGSCRVIALDLIGHGQSELSEDEIYSLDTHAAMIEEWLEGLGIMQAQLFGHSMGGYLTLAVAQRKPAFLQAFGLLHSTALPDSEQARDNRDAAINTVKEKGVAAFVSNLVPKLVAADHPERKALIEAAVEIGNETSANAVIGYARGMKERPDRTVTIEQSRLPVLLVSGAKDAVVNTDQTFAGRQAATRCEVIEDAGHMGMLETPQQLADVLMKFIGTVH